MPPLGNLVSPWIQKTAGILVKAFPNMLKHVKIVKIFVKERHLEKSSIKKLEAVSPNANCKVFAIRNLQSLMFFYLIST